jgi:hypothetical protein
MITELHISYILDAYLGYYWKPSDSISITVTCYVANTLIPNMRNFIFPAM